MPVKPTLLILATLMIIGEVICFAIPWIIQPEAAANSVSPQSHYVPYVFTALTISFLAFFTLLFAFIYLMLKGKLKEHQTDLMLLVIAFLLPIISYLSFY